MTYYLNLFSPATYEVFSRSGRDVSGFRETQRLQADRVKPGDILVCYLTKVSRWVGLLEVQEGPYIDRQPIYSDPDPFVVRFRVGPIVWLDDVTKALPIRAAEVSERLSFTQNKSMQGSQWTGKLRASLTPLSDEDGRLLEELLSRQTHGGKIFPLSPEEQRRMNVQRVRALSQDVPVIVPDDDDGEQNVGGSDVRESIRIQALLAKIGHRMGMRIWIPRADRERVLTELNDPSVRMLDRLPLNYDDKTIRTIELIDVLWLRGRAIQRAFEVEHTTSIYSGILRMADLLALQPNMDIRLHLVAPIERKGKVFQELQRPVFALLERGQLSERCTYLSYEAIEELASEPQLMYLRDDVITKYEEYAEEAEE